MTLPGFARHSCALNFVAGDCLALLGLACICIDWHCFALLSIFVRCLGLLGVAWHCLALPSVAWPCLALLGMRGVDRRPFPLRSASDAAFRRPEVAVDPSRDASETPALFNTLNASASFVVSPTRPRRPPRPLRGPGRHRGGAVETPGKPSWASNRSISRRPQGFVLWLRWGAVSR